MPPIPGKSPIEQSVRQCSFYFGILSVLVAGLVGLGAGSWNLPVLVGLAALMGFLYTDVLKWFSIPKFLVYFLMIAGAFVAVVDFLRDVGSDRLLAVGNLLIYVQLPLVFQKKTKRVFEQWGIFLLLELVVAALVNDNIFYGILLIPILSTGSLALIALNQYSSQLTHSESGSGRVSIWNQIVYYMRRMGSATGSAAAAQSGIELKAVSLDSFDRNDLTSYKRVPRSAAFAITFSALLFTFGYFYTLPRMSVGAYEAESWFSPSVGFSEQISLRYRGDVRQNETEVLRIQMVNDKDGERYRPSQPPYIRLAVLHRYLDGPTRGIWQKGDTIIIPDPKQYRPLPEVGELVPELKDQSDSIVVSVMERISLGEHISAIPPFAMSEKLKSMYISRRDWRLMDASEESRTRSIKRRYSFRSYSFLRGDERRLLPDSYDITINRNEDQKNKDGFDLYRFHEVTNFPPSLEPILAFRDAMLSETDLPVEDKVGRAIFLERYLSTHPSFQYSLRLTPPVNSTIDPIVDFLLNKKKGHCEFYASSLAMLLRSMDIPTRVVTGFRPNDFNDLGGYLSVQQKHAHAWVEAYFTMEELRSHDRLWETVPEYGQRGMWMRMDPTPAGEGSNAGGAFKPTPGQTFVLMQDLWTELIVNMDQTRQGNLLSIFGDASEGSYADFWADVQAFLARVQSSPFLGGLANPSRWFSWRAAIVIAVSGIVLVCVHRLLVWFLPSWSLRAIVRRRKAQGVTQVDFYNRIVKSLRRLGIERTVGQTPHEFLGEASRILSKKSIEIDAPLLASTFYAMRYGDQELLGPDEESRVEEALRKIDSADRRDFRIQSAEG